MKSEIFFWFLWYQPAAWDEGAPRKNDNCLPALIPKAHTSVFCPLYTSNTPLVTITLLEPRVNTHEWLSLHGHFERIYWFPGAFHLNKMVKVPTVFRSQMLLGLLFPRPVFQVSEPGLEMRSLDPLWRTTVAEIVLLILYCQQCLASFTLVPFLPPTSLWPPLFIHNFIDTFSIPESDIM